MEGPLQTSIHVCRENGQWMSRLPEKLWDIPLYNLALPGSHDTMTYCLDETSAVSGNESKLVKFLNKCIPCIVHPIIMKWSTTQELTVTEQLEAGVRYLDFRIAHKANDPSMNLYFVHMVYTTVTVQDILWEVLRWLETHPQEVVILACRNFDGLTRKLHCLLIAYIKEIFQCKLCPRNVVPTLRTMWQHGHQVIVSYEEDLEVEEHCELWPAIPYWWGNKTATRALIQYLEHMKRMGRPGRHRESLGGDKGHVWQCKTSRKLGDHSIMGYNHFVRAVCTGRTRVAECPAHPWVSATFIFGGANTRISVCTCIDYINCGSPFRLSDPLKKQPSAQACSLALSCPSCE
ncbi:PI-PLC X domain-containing protein 1 isoform X1 [Strix aluco]|uniref:PI-PLC X domain-containing protein 1 isoform X1 n=1 Tax=Strix aluco TaxID=111821 RepID=UPI003DA5E9EC